MKRGFFSPGSETEKMINCEQVIIQRVVSHFFLLHFNNPYLISVPKIAEVTDAI